MPVATVTPLEGGLQRVRFVESPRMSTYLLFLSIGDFERVHRDVDGLSDTPRSRH
jgi:aminopeptidase N